MRLEALRDHACLIIQGADQPGLVEQVSSVVTRNKGNIVTLDQYSDNPHGGHFFQRVVFHRSGLQAAFPTIKSDLAKTLQPLGMEWRITNQSVAKRMAILASKSDHCLMDLLWRYRRGLLPVKIPIVISNYPDHMDVVRSFGIPYFHIPSKKGPDKEEAETKILELLAGTKPDFVVLARYMQIFSQPFIDKLGVPVLNIHHSFLPAFIGTNPYKRAKDRGVKLIGATAHYVTEDLDEGPIIEQDVIRVTHAMTTADLRERGAMVERSVLSRAVTWHAEDRVIRHCNHTIVFA